MPDTAPQFLDAWRRSQRGTWLVVERFTRLGLSTADLRRGGRHVACGADRSGVFRCREGSPPPPYGAASDAELSWLRQAVSGPGRAYRVTAAGEGCFGLHLVKPAAGAAEAPFGQDATMCFDQRTGALVRSIVRRSGSVDERRAIMVRSEVRDADLTLPKESG